MSACDSERVVITGIGMATALAGDREGSWRAVKEGRRGARWLPSEFPHFGGNRGRDGRSSTQWAGAPAAPVSVPEIGLSARTVAAI
ncbi:MAG: hypothetical protein GXP27_04955, partial [Planctomycetes bacterium]|nr:hypothetical protein [Planctomycetota bacterium]